jgi:hypothetical protein
MEHMHFHYILVAQQRWIFAMAPECLRLSGNDPRDPTIVDAHADARPTTFTRSYT